MCMGPTHRVAAVAAWLAVAPVLPLAPWQVVAGAVVAGAAGNGRLSPDADQAYYLSSKFIPGGHRGITHFWVIPLAMFAAGLRAGDQGWWILAAAVAWASHILADTPFGRVPVWYGKHGWVRAGWHLKTGGKIELLLALPTAVVSVLVLTIVDGFGGLGPVAASIGALR